MVQYLAPLQYVTSSKEAVMREPTELLEELTCSPGLQLTGVTLPSSSFLPGPTATTSPIVGLSALCDVKITPPVELVSPSATRIKIRSCNHHALLRHAMTHCYYRFRCKNNARGTQTHTNVTEFKSTHTQHHPESRVFGRSETPAVCCAVSQK
jgi:hypothetical protein